MDLLIVLVQKIEKEFTKNKERIKNLNKQEILIIFIKMNLIKHVFNMIWHLEILEILKKRTIGDKVLRD